MPEGFEVVVEALRTHVTSLGEVGDVLSEANRSASQTMPPAAYGALAQAFPAMVEQLATRGRDALGASVEAADRMADAMSKTAQEYQAMDDDTAGTMDGMHE